MYTNYKRFVLYKSYACGLLFLFLGKYLWNHVMPPTNMCYYNQLITFICNIKKTKRNHFPPTYV